MSFTFTAPPNTPSSPIIQLTTQNPTPQPKTQPIPIPTRQTHHAATPMCSTPPHLLPSDPRPSLIHHGRENITSFTTLWSFKRDIAISRSEDLITAPHRLAPPCWVEVLGAGPSDTVQRRRKEMVMRDVVVVKPGMDRVGIARWNWVCEQQAEEEWEQGEERGREVRREEVREWKRKADAMETRTQGEGVGKGKGREMVETVGRVQCGVLQGDGDEGFSVW